MGDRFYLQQQKVLGICPGSKFTKRKRKMAWDDDKRAQAIAMYTEAEPTPESSMEVVKMIADELGESPNGVRMILTKAEVYVKKAAGASVKKEGAGAAGGARVSKAAAIEALTAAINDAGQAVDEEILSKLTGKAAQYFTEVVNGINK